VLEFAGDSDDVVAASEIVNADNTRKRFASEQFMELLLNKIKRLCAKRLASEQFITAALSQYFTKRANSQPLGETRLGIAQHP
jgi:hypothetical protein